MNNQIYMKLEDKVKRPILNIDKIDSSNIHFKKIVDNYSRWIGGNEEITELENEIRLCFKSNDDDDGYKLAKHLESEVGIEPDTNLVEILDNIGYTKKYLELDMYKQWVTENFLEIPSDVIGKFVKSKSRYHTREGYINNIYNNTYQVTINTDFNKKGGYVINYEDIVV